MTNYFNYNIELALEKESFANFYLKEAFAGNFAKIESIGFDSYQVAADSCNKLCQKLSKHLTKISGINHNLAWEANPKSGIKSGNITLANNWHSGELVKIYITTNKTGEVLTLDNIQDVATAIIYIGVKDNSYTN